MNRKLLSLGLALCCAPIGVSHAQEPFSPSPKARTAAFQSDQPSDDSVKAPKRKVLDLRTKKHRAKKKTVAKHAATRRKAPAAEPSELHGPIIANPVYLPETAPTSAAAITESRGFLYVVVGQKLYKVDEKTLKTVQTSALGRLDHAALDTDVPKKHRKIVASTDDEPSQAKTKKKRGSSADN